MRARRGGGAAAESGAGQAGVGLSERLPDEPLRPLGSPATRLGPVLRGA